MTVRVDVWLDFISPFCFLLSNNIQLLEQDRSLDVHWRSLPLRQPSARVSSGTRQIVHAERQYAAEIARTTYGLTLFPGPIEMDTVPAHIATKYAEMHGRAGAFVAAAMKAYWIEARSLADKSVVQDLLRDIGLKGKLVPDPMDARLLSDGIEIDRGLARAYDIHAVPVLVFERKHVVQGLQPYPVLAQICARLEAQADGSRRRPAAQGVLGRSLKRNEASI